MYPEETYQYAQPSQTNHLPIKRLLLAVITFAVIVFAIIGVINLLNAQSTGILDVSVSDNSATITVAKGTDTPKTIGKGHIRTRLKPGTYQVTASNGNNKTSTYATINAKATTTTQLTLENSIPTPQVARYGAQSMYAGEQGALYFLNTPESVLYKYGLSDASAKPYRTYNNNLSRVYWVTPTQFIAKNTNNDWSYINNDQTTPIAPPGEGIMETSVHANASGVVSLITDSAELAMIEKPGFPLKTLTKLKGNFSTPQTRITPDSKFVLVYAAPMGDSGSSNLETMLYTNNSLETLPSSVKSPIDAEWSPDSSAFSFSNGQGIYIYDRTSKNISPILASHPTNPLSVSWVTPKLLLYADAGAIWKYQTDTHISTKLTDITGSLDTYHPFTVAPDGQTVYFSPTSDEQGNGVIYKLLLNYNQLKPEQQQAFTQTPASQPNVSYNNFNSLLEYGVTDDQVANLKFSLGQYMQSTNNLLQTAAIDTTSVKAGDYDPEHPPAMLSIYFNVVLNYNTYKAELDYKGTTVTRLHLYSTDKGNQVYDSGIIDASH